METLPLRRVGKRQSKDIIDSWENETPVTRAQELISIEEQILRESALTQNVSAGLILGGRKYYFNPMIR